MWQIVGFALLPLAILFVWLMENFYNPSGPRKVANKLYTQFVGAVIICAGGAAVLVFTRVIPVEPDNGFPWGKPIVIFFLGLTMGFFSWMVGFVLPKIGKKN